MNIFIHALFSLGIARAAQRHLPRFGLVMLLVAGVAPDLDSASYFFGASAYLRIHRAALHSLVGGLLTAFVIAGLFCMLDKKLPLKVGARKLFTPLSFRVAFAVCATGVLGHVLLDMVSGVGVQLLWPFDSRWFGTALVPSFDLWIFLLLIVGMALPLLFKMVNEEVGEHAKESGRVSAVVMLFLVAAYVGARAEFRVRAIGSLLAREYGGEIPLAAGAFPTSSNPFEWHGLAVTDNTIEEADVSAGPGAGIETERTATHYKPGESPALDAAEKTDAAQRFLRYAKFPLASVTRRDTGYRVEIRDLRFAAGDADADNIVVRVNLDSGGQVREQGLHFASEGNP